MSIELPSDRRLLRVGDAAREALEHPGGYAVVGAAGSGPALLARALLASGASQVLYLAPSHEVGLRAVEDLKALGTLGLPAGTGDEPTPLFLGSSETSPYADVHPGHRQVVQHPSDIRRPVGLDPYSGDGAGSQFVQRGLGH